MKNLIIQNYRYIFAILLKFQFFEYQFVADVLIFVKNNLRLEEFSKADNLN